MDYAERQKAPDAIQHPDPPPAHPFLNQRSQTANPSPGTNRRVTGPVTRISRQSHVQPKFRAAATAYLNEHHPDRQRPWLA